MLLPTAALFVVSLGFGVVVPLLPDLAGGRAVTDEGMLSVVFASYSTAKILFQVPGGVWVDRIGPHRALEVGLAAFTVSLAGFMVGEDLGWFALVRVVEGAATGIVFPAVFALALQGRDPSTSGRLLGLIGGIGTSGVLVGPVLGGLLAPIDTRLPVLVAMAAGAVMTVLVVFSRRRRPTDQTSGKRRSVADEVRRIRTYLLSLTFVATIAPIGFNKLTYSSFQGLIPLCGPDYLDLTIRGVTGLFVLGGVGFAVCQPLGGALADRVGARRLIVAMSVLQISSLGALSLATDIGLFTAAFSAYVLAGSMNYTATMKELATTFGQAAEYGSLFGIMGTLTDIMVVLGPLIFINLYAGSGALVFAAMAIAGAPFFLAYIAAGGRATSPGVS